MNNERLYKIILGAHISEKASVIADDVNQFAFKVAKDATTPEIKEAVEKIYDVEKVIPSIYLVTDLSRNKI